jgi:hypothetical protein
MKAYKYKISIERDSGYFYKIDEVAVQAEVRLPAEPHPVKISVIINHTGVHEIKDIEDRMKTCYDKTEIDIDTTLLSKIEGCIALYKNAKSLDKEIQDELKIGSYSWQVWPFEKGR